MLMARITVEFTICFGDFFLLIKIVKSRHRSPIAKILYVMYIYICNSTCYSIDAKGVVAYLQVRSKGTKSQTCKREEGRNREGQVNTTGAVGSSLPA